MAKIRTRKSHNDTRVRYKSTMCDPNTFDAIVVFQVGFNVGDNHKLLDPIRALELEDEILQALEQLNLKFFP